MKIASFYICILVLAGCTTTSDLSSIPASRRVATVDLTPYADQGFLITPERYDGPYDALGQIYVWIYPRAIRVEDPGETVMSRTQGRFHWEVEQIDFSMAIDSLYAEARRLGADAIMNFDVSVGREHPYLPYSGTGYGLPTQDQMQGIYTSGFAIRRKDN
jgi:hypothetical protein